MSEEQQINISSSAKAEDIDWKEFQIYQEYNDDDHAAAVEEDEENHFTDTVFKLFDQQGNDEEEYEIFEYQLPSVALTTNKTTSKLTLRHKSETSNSTGLGLWIGADLLCEYLVEHPELVKGKNVLELGSGTGFCGLVVHHLGAEHVLMTDGDVDVLSNLRYNVQQNTAANESSIVCPQLIWGKKYVDTFIRDYGRQNVIMACDCTYMTKSVVPLWETVSNVLSLEEDAVFIYVMESASSAPVDLVVKTASNCGFIWEEPVPGVKLFRRCQRTTPSN